MRSTTTLFIALLPLLGVDATRYRGSGGGLQTSMSQLQSTGDTKQGTKCSNDGTKNAGSSSGCNDCGLSTFTELSTPSDQHPLVTDCQAMINNIAQDQEWEVTTSSRVVAWWGTCSFNAIAQGGKAKIGNGDIIDLVNDSIRRFTKTGRVGAHGSYKQTVTSAGTTNCDNAVAGSPQVQIDWTLTARATTGHHPPGVGHHTSGGHHKGGGGSGGSRSKWQWSNSNSQASTNQDTWTILQRPGDLSSAQNQDHDKRDAKKTYKVVQF